MKTFLHEKKIQPCNDGANNQSIIQVVQCIFNSFVQRKIFLKMSLYVGKSKIIHARFFNLFTQKLGLNKYITFQHSFLPFQCT